MFTDVFDLVSAIRETSVERRASSLSSLMNAIEDMGWMNPETISAHFLRRHKNHRGSPSEPLYKLIETLGTLHQGYSPLPYHNAAHAAEVALNAWLVGQMEDITRIEEITLVAAGLGHDLFVEPPTGEPLAPFFQEHRSAHFVQRIALDCGVSEISSKNIFDMISSTWPGFRTTLRQILNNKTQEITIGLPQHLMKNPSLLSRCCILSDADLMPSAATTPLRHALMNERLALEMSWDMVPQNVSKRYIGFIDHIVGDSFLTESAQHCFGAQLAENRKSSS